MRPHTCPRCEGEKRIVDPRVRDWVKCPTCEGVGVVWEPEGGQQEAALVGDDPRDINGL